MRQEQPFNPLDKRNLGISVADAMLNKQLVSLPLNEAFIGAGIYAIYYDGDFPLYAPISERNRNDQWRWPIYIGKAVPAGARRGGFGLGENPGMALFKRLQEHADSISDARNLDLSSFHCRYLAVDDIWIPLGESLLIDRFAPLWNRCLDGFGNHDPGSGRRNQQRSPWDMIHPGRNWADRLPPNLRSETEVVQLITEYIAKTLPLIV